MVDTKLNMSVQCVVEKAKEPSGLCYEGHHQESEANKTSHCSVLMRTHLKCWVQLQYKEKVQAGWKKESGEGSPKPFKGLKHLTYQGKLSETWSCLAWRRKVLGSYLCNGMTRGIEKTELDSFGSGKEQKVTGKICEL